MKFRISDRRFQWLLVVILAGLIVYTISDALRTPAADTPTWASIIKDTPTAISLDNRTSDVLHEDKPLSNRIVEYHMNVEYNPDNKELQGQQVITWKNPGTMQVDELYLHTYPNAFSSKKTTFMKESGGKLREDHAVEGSYGSMKITSITTQKGQDLSVRMWYVQPDDGNIDDHTLLKISLPEAVKPGESITFSTKFTVALPHVFARMGVIDDFVMAGQWFPKLAVYEPAGTRGRAQEGWNLHQYHGNSEFYADFGIYDVKIKVPSNYIVAATGLPTKPAIEDSVSQTKTYAFYADDVHDFAWSASPNFRYYEEPFATKQIPGVKIKLYLDPRHEDLKDRYFAAAKKALTRYSEWYGQYPYATLSIVVPPKGGNGAGGMEYPTLVTGWSAESTVPSLELERVVVHEIGHQYWYGMVASNEFEEAWLDEGFTSYAEDAVMEAEYGVRANLPIEASYITSPAALKLNSWDYRDHNEYADNVYIRAKLVLRSIESNVGKQTMARIMRTYFERWKFKHPATKDFQTVVEEVTNENWSSFFNQYVYGELMMDFSVDSIQVKKPTQGDSTVYESTVLVHKRGGTAPKVPILFHFADNHKEVRVWEGTEASTSFKLYHTSPVDWAMIDPNYSLVLENKHINNFYKKDIDPKWQVRWNLGVSQLVETVFSWIAW
ncbi:M1 family peptidase [Paenibacillus albiflavus]|uniref:M1 family peptidase n=1 Tax=Paenibacillus albiflavus TaxID=2545760 RepID=A0A4R4EFS6_9BACL|nr:M1 family metallopeptidase [Paenibacillus albiflavus]TCZ78924.1 M1 family peptidase [Paenibacillus albiflavus]